VTPPPNPYQNRGYRGRKAGFFPVPSPKFVSEACPPAPYWSVGQSLGPRRFRTSPSRDRLSSNPRYTIPLAETCLLGRAMPVRLPCLTLIAALSCAPQSSPYTSRSLLLSENDWSLFNSFKVELQGPSNCRELESGLRNCAPRSGIELVLRA